MHRSSRECLFMLLMGSFLIIYIVWPLAGLFLRADWSLVLSSYKDSEIVGALWRSVWTASAATGIIALFGTPLAYFLARRNFPKTNSLVEFVKPCFARTACRFLKNLFFLF